MLNQETKSNIWGVETTGSSTRLIVFILAIIQFLMYRCSGSMLS